MSDLFVFGGTTEGRLLCDFLEQQQITAHTFVATGYGQQLLEVGYRWVTVHCGRLEPGEMVTLLQREQPALVVDATHPYATMVTAHLQQACWQTGIAYVRLLRPSESVEGVHRFSSLQSLMDWLQPTTGRIFSTLGSKELSAFQQLTDYRQRLVVRVLPDETVMRQCAQMGLCGGQIVAMQGPFSQELNEALFRQWKADILVTKEAGKAGGFLEKITAAQNCGMEIAVLQRPQQEHGCTLEQLKQRLQDGIKMTGESHRDQREQRGARQDDSVESDDNIES